jgi:hypothetical protein
VPPGLDAGAGAAFDPELVAAVGAGDAPRATTTGGAAGAPGAVESTGVLVVGSPAMVVEGFNVTVASTVPTGVGAVDAGSGASFGSGSGSSALALNGPIAGSIATNPPTAAMPIAQRALRAGCGLRRRIAPARRGPSSSAEPVADAATAEAGNARVDGDPVGPDGGGNGAAGVAVAAAVAMGGGSTERGAAELVAAGADG